MRVYESVIIVNSSLHEDTLNRIVSNCENIIEKNGGKLRVTDKWGKRRLAYPINKFQYGYYVLFEFEAPPQLIGELEREYRLNENILRFMTIHRDKKAILAEQRKKEKDEHELEELTAKIDDGPELGGEGLTEIMTEDEEEPAFETQLTDVQELEDTGADTLEAVSQDKTEESKPEDAGDTADELPAESVETVVDTMDTEEKITQASGDDSDKQDDSESEESAQNDSTDQDNSDKTDNKESE